MKGKKFVLQKITSNLHRDWRIARLLFLMPHLQRSQDVSYSLHWAQGPQFASVRRCHNKKLAVYQTLYSSPGEHGGNEHLDKNELIIYKLTACWWTPLYWQHIGEAPASRYEPSSQTMSAAIWQSGEQIWDITSNGLRRIAACAIRILTCWFPYLHTIGYIVICIQHFDWSPSGLDDKQNCNVRHQNVSSHN